MGTGMGFGLGGWISSYVAEAILNDWGNALSYGILALTIGLMQMGAVRLAKSFYHTVIQRSTDFLWDREHSFWQRFHAISGELVGYYGYISWLTMTIGGGIISGRLSTLASWNLSLTFEDDIDSLLIYGTLRGFITGLFQWLVLRRYAVHQLKDYAMWWVIITAMSGGLSFRIGVNLIARLQFWTPTVTGLIYGACTGLAYLAWIYGNIKYGTTVRQNE